MIWKPHATVATIVEKDNKFLMVEELSEGQHVINQPAGHLDEGESLIDAAIRETLEETAWHVSVDYITGIYRWQHPDKDATFLRVCFAATAISHDPDRELDEGILDAIWMSREDLFEKQSQLRSPMVLQGIDDYLAGNQYPLDLLVDIDET
jgi:8-oxo-dGTP pyrophosphatase MutT (NUDIX family)